MSDTTSLFHSTVLANFNFSISAHNVQPFRLKWKGAASLEIWVEPERLLPVADPKNKDLIMSCGALYETLRLALAARRLSLTVGALASPDTRSRERGNAFFLARFDMDEQNGDARLADQLPRRFSYRGSFTAFTGSTRDIPKERVLDDLHLVFMTDAGAKSEIARLYDEVNLRFLSLPGYTSELASWLRLSPRHPQWKVDGLNSESMSLSKFEAWGASFIFKPYIFKTIRALGLAGPLMSEKPKVESAHAIVALAGPRQGPFEAGREMMRGWLALAEMDLHGAPLSLLTDDPRARSEVAHLFSLSNDWQIYNVLRVGRLPREYRRPEPARRNIGDLIMTEEST